MISNGALELRPGCMMAGAPNSLCTAAALLKERFSKSESVKQKGLLFEITNCKTEMSTFQNLKTKKKKKIFIRNQTSALQAAESIN